MRIRTASAIAQVKTAVTLGEGQGWCWEVGNNPELNEGNSNQIIGVGISPRKPQDRDLVEVETNTFYRLRTIAKKVQKKYIHSWKT